MSRCGVRELGHRCWPGLLCGSLVFVEEAAEDGPTLDPFLGEVGDRVVGPGRAELAAAMGTSPVAVVLVLGQDRPQMPLAEDRHPLGDLRPGGEHEPFPHKHSREGSGAGFHGLDTGVGQDCVERLGELPGSVADQEPEVHRVDLRLAHAAVSLWLNAGVPAPQVAERAGHSVEVLLRVYAKCLDDSDKAANMRIDTADGEDVHGLPARSQHPMR